ncbi:MAG: hypothetical protein JSV54_01345 [Chloroflexota bacterium]|nr:MAG: hypothetical protein JSV54_01345 [Chloroflexota bacterium]
MRALTKILHVALCLLVLVSIVACSAGKETEPKFRYESDAALHTLLEAVPAYPETSFVVFSDPHIYDPTLGTEGKAFED